MSDIFRHSRIADACGNGLSFAPHHDIKADYADSSEAMNNAASPFRFILMLSAMIFSMSLPVHAGALDWLKTKRNKPRNAAEKSTDRSQSLSSTAEELPDFFKAEEKVDLSGKGLSPFEFAETHWTHSKQILEVAVRRVIEKFNNNRISDSCTKLFSISTQIYRESLKTCAQSLTSLSEGNEKLGELLDELNRIITAPREETLANFEGTVQKISQANYETMQSVKAYLTGSENLINAGAESYQTLELIPSLSLVPIDEFVQSCKQLMSDVRSGNETLKGFLLNVQNSCERTTTGLDQMIQTLKTTLKYSDHFAFRQFPLINLPVPTRERVFSQIGSLKNISKGIDNTLQICDSHLRNSAQQITHLMQNASDKMIDALKYQQQIDFSTGNLPQLSLYATNQVNGLYQRTREIMLEMRTQMTKAARANPIEAAPRIAVETSSGHSPNLSKFANGQKLPLFLLGNTEKSNTESTSGGHERAGTDYFDRQEKPELQKKFAEINQTRGVTADLRPDELNLLEKEFGEPLISGGQKDSAIYDGSLESHDDLFQLSKEDSMIFDGKGYVSADCIESPNPVRNEKQKSESKSASNCQTDYYPAAQDSLSTADSAEFGDFIPLFQLD